MINYSRAVISTNWVVLKVALDTGVWHNVATFIKVVVFLCIFMIALSLHRSLYRWTCSFELEVSYTINISGLLWQIIDFSKCLNDCLLDLCGVRFPHCIFWRAVLLFMHRLTAIKQTIYANTFFFLGNVSIHWKVNIKEQVAKSMECGLIIYYPIKIAHGGCLFVPLL